MGDPYDRSDDDRDHDNRGQEVASMGRNRCRQTDLCPSKRCSPKVSHRNRGCRGELVPQVAQAALQVLDFVYLKHEGRLMGQRT